MQIDTSLDFNRGILCPLSQMKTLWTLHSEVERKGFICDTGAACTLSFDASDYTDNGIDPGSLLFANGDKVKLQGQGSGEVAGVTLPISFSPELQVKLLSISSFLDNAGTGGKAIFTAEGGKLISRQGIFKIKRQGSMYYLDEQLQATYFTGEKSSSSDEDPATVAHQRFAHCGKTALRRMGLDFKVSNCEVCMQVQTFGKRYRRLEHGSNEYALIHWDVNTLQESITGEKYVAVLLDDRSRYVWTGVFKSKSEISKWTSTMVRKLSKESASFGLKIMSLRADNGSEILSTEVLSTLEELGIEGDFIVPYSPALNGMAERIQGTLLLRMRALLLQSGLPPTYLLANGS
jgi:hypothetical protein